MNRWTYAAAVALFAGAVVVGLQVFSSDPPGVVPDGATDSPLVYEIDRDPDVPDLPFDDNPDPAQCGIPVQWGDSNSRAWLSGTWQGDLIQPDVLLYESHLRVSLTGSAPHGSEVEIVLFQENPVLDYYFVRIAGETLVEGWVPEPFLSFEPVT